MLLALRTVLEGLVTIANVAEKVDLVLGREEGSTDAVDRCISPTLVVKSALLIEEVEEFAVRLASPEIEIADLEIAPKMATIIRLSSIVGYEVHSVVFRHQFWVRIQELFYSIP